MEQPGGSRPVVVVGQQAPQACTPFGQDVGAAPCGQVMLHWSTWSQETLQDPRHSTSQIFTPVQPTMLFGPTRT
jgi:hypothetical protein